ncbi:hypothetical protein B0E50_07460 [Rhodanobacter sp. C01]|nr:hypothetical protein B0E50_07460 [Rhodanobacter sp. C01]
MLKITQKTRNQIFYAGVVLALAGGGLAYWAFQRYNTLPNYLRIAVLIPLLCSYPMLIVDKYRDWASVQGIARGYAIGALIGPPLLLVGCLIWLVVAPDARG